MRKLIIYKDRKKQFRWKLIAINGKKIANGGEGYINKQDCLMIVQTIVLGPYELIDTTKKAV